MRTRPTPSPAFPPLFPFPAFPRHQGFPHRASEFSSCAGRKFGGAISRSPGGTPPRAPRASPAGGTAARRHVGPGGGGGKKPKPRGSQTSGRRTFPFLKLGTGKSKTKIVLQSLPASLWSINLGCQSWAKLLQSPKQVPNIDSLTIHDLVFLGFRNKTHGACKPTIAFEHQQPCWARLLHPPPPEVLN